MSVGEAWALSAMTVIIGALIFCFVAIGSYLLLYQRLAFPESVSVVFAIGLALISEIVYRKWVQRKP